MVSVKMFNPLIVSSKFAICGLPIRMDTYSLCSFNCEYCFANNRQRGKKSDKEPNVGWLKGKFKKIYDDKAVNKENFLDVLLQNRITLHGGSMSDCFQRAEKEKHNTRKIVEICNEYDQHILFSTKTDTAYDVPLDPKLHTFQLSVSNLENIMESNVPKIENRLQFYRMLKSEGFKVGIRIQPFIPNVTDVKEIVETFHDADHYTIECLKFDPHNVEYNKGLMDKLGLRREDYKQQGSLTMLPQLRLEHYENFIDFFKTNNYSWSIADNDMHWLGNNLCCCGDKLVEKQTLFHNTRMLQLCGNDYQLKDISVRLKDYKDCKCSSLFNSDRREGCSTVEEFYIKRFGRKSSPFSPKYQYHKKQKSLDDFLSMI